MSVSGKRKLVLEDGSEYIGEGFGQMEEERIAELVFNTSVVGYQEIFSDPSYTDQFVVMAYPLIGNYGINGEDFETGRPSIGGFIVRDYNDVPSNFRSEKTLSESMKEFGIPGLSVIDTRMLVRRIRKEGCMRAILTEADVPAEEAKRRLQRAKIPHDSVKRVSRKKIREYFPENAGCRIAAIDFGMKENILRSFLARGCEVTVFPWNASKDDILSAHPDGLFLSNGPGDPEDVPEAIGTVRSMIGGLPIFGICLGHQILSLAYGAKTYKLKFGHRGGNHPVKNLLTGRIEITSQNHSYAVDESSIRNTPLKISHINLLDRTVEGVMCDRDLAFSVQYHPESAPGPQESAYLFDRFLHMVKESRG